MKPLVVAVILNTNRREDTLACLRSLAQSTYDNLATLVLDNASTDGSVEAIRTEFPEVQIVPLPENKGYAGNNNVGIRLALEQGADWVFVLNEDTLLAPDCIEQLIAAGESDPQVGIVGPMVYHADEPAVIQFAGGLFGKYWRPIHLGQNQPDTGQFCEVRPVDWVAGCALMIRRPAVEDIGLIDERFFYYWEETDWCVRAGKNGWRILHVPQAKIWHKGVQLDYRPSPVVTYYDTRNRFLFLSKHLRGWQYAHALTTTLLQEVCAIAAYTLKPCYHHLRRHRDARVLALRDVLLGRWGKMGQDVTMICYPE